MYIFDNYVLLEIMSTYTRHIKRVFVQLVHFVLTVGVMSSYKIT